MRRPTAFPLHLSLLVRPAAGRAALALALLGTCAPPLAGQARLEYTEVHMALPVRIVVHAADEPHARAAVRAAFERVVELEDILSHYRPQSELRRLEAAAPGEWTEASADLFAVLARALEIAEATKGAFDPTLGPLTALWREARAAGRLPDAHALDSARARTGWRLVELDSARHAVRLRRDGVRFDLGGVAKGYILQSALDVLRARGLPRALVEAGGDVVVGEAPPGRAGWRIDVASPDGALASRAAALTDAALATSGAGAQFVELGGVRYSHVIDPRTGLGVTTPFVAHVIAPDAASADALATALSVLGPDAVEPLLARFEGVMASVQVAEPPASDLPLAWR